MSLMFKKNGLWANNFLGFAIIEHLPKQLFLMTSLKSFKPEEKILYENHTFYWYLTSIRECTEN